MQEEHNHSRISMQEAKLPRNFLSQATGLLSQHIDDLFSEAISYCESPIEATFATAFMLLGEHSYGGVAIYEPGFNGTVNPLAAEFVLQCQPKIGKYRADFVAGWSYPEYPGRIIVECDGHAFHERTKEQAARDKLRDRELQRAGYKVFRFTGSEIYADAFLCATEVFEALCSMADEERARL